MWQNTRYRIVWLLSKNIQTHNKLHGDHVPHKCPELAICRIVEKFETNFTLHNTRNYKTVSCGIRHGDIIESYFFIENANGGAVTE